MNLNKHILHLLVSISLVLIIQACDKINELDYKGHEALHGIVKDFHQTNGCGMVFELEDGTIIVPYQLDTGLMIAEGQEILIEYTVVQDTTYLCKEGILAEITYFKQSGCSPIIVSDHIFTAGSLAADPFEIKHAELHDDCLKIVVTYGGGCRIHEFIMFYSELPKFSSYDGLLTLDHNAHGDHCEALLTDTIAFNLIPLRKEGVPRIRLALEESGDMTDYQLIIDYFY